MFTATNTSLNSRIAEEIRAEMARQKLTAVKLAQSAGISRQAISARLNGQRPLTAETMELAANLLKVPVSAIVRRAEAQLTATTEPTADRGEAA